MVLAGAYIGISQIEPFPRTLYERDPAISAMLHHKPEKGALSRHEESVCFSSHLLPRSHLGGKSIGFNNVLTFPRLSQAWPLCFFWCP